VQRSGRRRQDAVVQDDRGPQPTLTGARVSLRPWRADDVDAVFAACQDAEIQRWTQVPVPYAREHAEGFVSGIAAETWAQGGACSPSSPATVGR
jgi:RimJ/RimL family protein N-acetyltransferase